YTISTTDAEQYMLSLAEKLDKAMNQVMATIPAASVTTAAVMTALSYLDELEKSSASADNMRGQIKNYLEDAATAKLDAEEARRELERLRRELGYLKGGSNG
ncbi:MAG: cell division protein ZapA, partial [Ruthenibacterium sp.]